MLPRLVRFVSDLLHFPDLPTAQQTQELSSTLAELLVQLRKLEGAKLTRTALRTVMDELAAATDRLARLSKALGDSLAARSVPAQPAYQLDDEDGESDA